MDDRICVWCATEGAKTNEKLEALVRDAGAYNLIPSLDGVDYPVGLHETCACELQGEIEALERRVQRARDRIAGKDRPA